MLLLQSFFDFDPILSFLGSTIDAIFSAISAFFIFLYNLLVTLVVFLWNVILIVAKFLLVMLGRIRDFFKTIWENVIKRSLVKLVQIYASIRAKLTKIFGPILRIIRRIRTWIDRHILPIVLRMINTIQRIRQILVVFRIMGFEWAKALDRKLAQLEGEIFQAFQRVRSQLNRVSTIINLIADPDLILRGNVLVRSILRALDAMSRGLFGVGIKDLIGTSGPGPTNDKPGLTTRTEAQEVSRAIFTPRSTYGFPAAQGADLYLAVWNDRR